MRWIGWGDFWKKPRRRYLRSRICQLIENG
jgi:hypothetical protein